MSDETLVGKRVDQYEIKGVLGRGEIGIVYRAYDSGANRLAAVKFLPRVLMQEAGFYQQFELQAARLAALEHPGIVKLYGVGEWDGRPYAAMRYMPGGSLAEMLRRYGSLAVGEVVPIVEQVAQALDYAHGQGVLHLNIKPTNVMLDEEGNASLSDFAIPRLREATPSLTGSQILGSAEYIAPEIARGERELTPAADVYALGATVFQMLVGRPPYRADTTIRLVQMHLEEPIPSLRAFNPVILPAVDVVVRGALAKTVDERYASAGEMARALSNALGQMATTTRGKDITNVLASPVDTPTPTPPPVPAPIRVEAPQPVTPPAEKTAKPSRREQRRLARKARQHGARRVTLGGVPWYTAVLVLLMFVVVWFAVGVLIGAEARRQVNLFKLAEIHSTQTPAAATYNAQATQTIQAYFGAFQTQTQAVLDTQATAQAPTSTPTPLTPPTPTATATATPLPTPLAGSAGLIAYVSERDGDPEIFLLDLLSGQVTQVTSNTTLDDHPAWSPDGLLLAFQSDVRAGGQHIAAVEASCAAEPETCPSKVTNLTTTLSVDSWPVWSTEGDRIAYYARDAGRYYLRTVTLRGRIEEITQVPGDVDLLDWAPDGSLIFFGAGLSGAFDIQRLPPGGISTDRVPITDARGLIEFITFSPDRRLAVYQALTENRRQLFLADATCDPIDDCVIRRLTDDWYNYTAPRFSPDGTLILVTSDRAGNRDLYVLDLEGRLVRQLTDRPYDEYNGAWQPAP